MDEKLKFITRLIEGETIAPISFGLLQRNGQRTHSSSGFPYELMKKIMTRDFIGKHRTFWTFIVHVPDLPL